MPPRPSSSGGRPRSWPPSTGVRPRRWVPSRPTADVTGFGLVGHARNIALGSGVTLRFGLGDLPLAEGASTSRETAWSREARIAAAPRSGPRCSSRRPRPLASRSLDAETSGGLLIAVDPEDAPTLEEALTADVRACRVGTP